MIEFLAHIVHIAANGQFDVILLPVEGRMDIDVPLLMQETIGGLYAVLTYHWSYPIGLNCFCCSLQTKPLL